MSSTHLDFVQRSLSGQCTDEPVSVIGVVRFSRKLNFRPHVCDFQYLPHVHKFMTYMYITFSLPSVPAFTRHNSQNVSPSSTSSTRQCCYFYKSVQLGKLEIFARPFKSKACQKPMHIIARHNHHNPSDLAPIPAEPKLSQSCPRRSRWCAVRMHSCARLLRFVSRRCTQIIPRAIFLRYTNQFQSRAPYPGDTYSSGTWSTPHRKRRTVFSLRNPCPVLQLRWRHRRLGIVLPGRR